MKKLVLLLLVSCQLNAQVTKTIKSLRTYVDQKLSEIRIPTVDLRGQPPGSVSAIEMGAIPNDGIDDTKALQALFDSTANHKNNIAYLNAGQYFISGSLIPPKDKSTGQTSIIIIGQGTAYTANSGDTRIKALHKKGFAIGIQRGKGCRIENLLIEGQNDLSYYTLYDILQNKEKTFVENGCEDARTHPYSGIMIDPYAEYGGSTDVQINNCWIGKFVVDIMISPSAVTLNGDLITGRNNWLGDAKSGIATGNHQTVSTNFYDTKIWSPMLYIVDSYNYGMGVGLPARLIGGNFAGGQRYLCRVGSWYTQATFSYIDAELLGSIGGCWSGRSTDINLIDCKIDLAGELVTPQGLIRNPNPIVQCDNFSLDGGRLVNWYAGRVPTLNFSANGVTLHGRMSAPVMASNGIVKYNMVNGINGTTKPTDSELNPLKPQTSTSAGAARVIAVDEQINTWTYTIANSTEKIKQGDNVVIYGKKLTGQFDFQNEDISLSGGTVKSVSGQKVTVSGVPYQLKVGFEISAYTMR